MGLSSRCSSGRTPNTPTINPAAGLLLLRPGDPASC